MKTNNTLLSILSPEEKAICKKVPQPDFVPPMLATLTINYFSDPNWIYEHKFDGQRCLVIKKNGKVHLMSRNRRIINNEYPELAAALTKQKADNFIIDGEIVATLNGLSDFELLQSRINLKDATSIEKKTKSVPVSLCIFDLIYIDGYDVCRVPLLTRKKLLKKLFKYNNLLLYTDHITRDGIPFFKKACRAKWEGVIAKKADSTYEHRRSQSWLKFKCIMKQELVIAGYTTARGARSDFGALLVGYYAKGKLKYAGKVGTGYSEETLRMLGKKLRALETKTCPFIDYDAALSNVHWAKPKLVAEFQFAQWTNNGKLRVGRYKGLRDDKSAQDVVKEVPKAIVHT